VPLTGGNLSGPEIHGTLVPGASADWQTVLPDGTALGDIRYTLRTDSGRVLSVQNKGVFVGVGGRRATGVIDETYLVA
jgi:Protein of unknown function (DUF3237)